MLFPKRTDHLAVRTLAALTTDGGKDHTFEITREFHIERIDLRFTLSAANARATEVQSDGVFGVVDRVILQIADGARTRNVVDATGPGLIELASNVCGLDRATLDCIGVNSAAARQFTVPLWFAHPQVDDPVGSALLLPAPRFNSNLNLTIRLKSQAQMDSNGAPTFNPVITIAVVVHRRQVGILNWPTFDTEIAESTTNFTASVAPGEIELPVPGNYTGVLARLNTAATTRGDISAGPASYYIDQLGTKLRRIRFLDQEAENDFSRNGLAATVGNRIGGSIYFDFLTDKAGVAVGDMGSVLDANALSQTGARPKFGIESVTGGAGVSCKLVTHRVFGVLDALKLGR